jgi:hypothetical protein
VRPHERFSCGKRAKNRIRRNFFILRIEADAKKRREDGALERRQKIKVSSLLGLKVLQF